MMLEDAWRRLEAGFGEELKDRANVLPVVLLILNCINFRRKGAHDAYRLGEA